MSKLNPSNVFSAGSDYLSRVYTAKKIYEQYFPLSVKELKQIDEVEMYKEIYSSNYIEGNSYNEFETRALLTTGVAPNGKPFKDGIEVHNLHRAVSFSENYSGKISKEFIKIVHKIVSSGLLDNFSDEGEFKTVRNWVGDINTCPPNAIDKEIGILIDWYYANKDILDPITLACRFKYRFLMIHPFVDCNGRVSRLLFNYILKSNGLCGISISPEDRSLYYESLKKSNLLGDKFKCEPLERFLCDCIVQTYNRRISMLEVE